MSCKTINIEIATLRKGITFQIVHNKGITFQIVNNREDILYACGRSEGIFINLFETANGGKFLAGTDNEFIVPE
tara:strand:- start:528 stop:749 length:222 start_codon:yes stop_codon:yes gene_type:complete